MTVNHQISWNPVIEKGISDSCIGTSSKTNIKLFLSNMLLHQKSTDTSCRHVNNHIHIHTVDTCLSMSVHAALNCQLPPRRDVF